MRRATVSGEAAVVGELLRQAPPTDAEDDMLPLARREPLEGVRSMCVCFHPLVTAFLMAVGRGDMLKLTFVFFFLSRKNYRNALETWHQ